MRTSSNPAFRNLPASGGYANFDSAGFGQPGYAGQQTTQSADDRPITVDDVVIKTGITLGVLVVAAVFSAMSGIPALTFVGLIGGLILGLVNAFKREPSKVLVLAYAGFEGLFLGGLSAMVASFFPGTAGYGIVAQAVMGTIGVFAGMLVVYKTGAIRVTPKLTRWVTGALIGVGVLMLANLVGNLFGADMGLRSGGTLAIIFSLVCIGIAAFVFLLDFKAADDLIQAGAPAKYGWQIAFGLTMTLVWLYIEILRLLTYLQGE
ncbi:Bax inhibitor-1/YccA family membrane protein [Actinoalloteichus caeruleus]|uniref:Bax inhibitor-1/YccA family protein n=1 Tax=Actinoalloteichus cyanogriseus TaxID=2893586 RepID=UPI0004AB8CB9|nr:Bax inhibitor-1/YccA family protein [Actinoalloteichus caeruleus]